MYLVNQTNHQKVKIVSYIITNTDEAFYISNICSYGIYLNLKTNEAKYTAINYKSIKKSETIQTNVLRDIDPPPEYFWAEN